jgi:hypothetical protein
LIIIYNTSAERRRTYRTAQKYALTSEKGESAADSGCPKNVGGYSFHSRKRTSFSGKKHQEKIKR